MPVRCPHSRQQLCVPPVSSLQRVDSRVYVSWTCPAQTKVSRQECFNRVPTSLFCQRCHHLSTLQHTKSLLGVGPQAPPSQRLVLEPANAQIQIPKRQREIRLKPRGQARSLFFNCGHTLVHCRILTSSNSQNCHLVAALFSRTDTILKEALEGNLHQYL